MNQNHKMIRILNERIHKSMSKPQKNHQTKDLWYDEGMLQFQKSMLWKFQDRCPEKRRFLGRQQCAFGRKMKAANIVMIKFST